MLGVGESLSVEHQIVSITTQLSTPLQNISERDRCVLPDTHTASADLNLVDFEMRPRDAESSVDLTDAQRSRILHLPTHDGRCAESSPGRTRFIHLHQ